MNPAQRLAMFTSLPTISEFRRVVNSSKFMSMSSMPELNLAAK